MAHDGEVVGGVVGPGAQAVVAKDDIHAQINLADSSLKCNDGMTRVYLFHKDLVRRFEAEAFSGTVVEPMRGEFDVIRGDGFEPHLLRKELTDEAVHILVGTALP